MIKSRFMHIVSAVNANHFTCIDKVFKETSSHLGSNDYYTRASINHE